MDKNVDLMNAVQVGVVLGISKARVHQLAQDGTDGSPPILPPFYEAKARSGRVTQRLWERKEVLRVLKLREALPPGGQGPDRWSPELAEAELAARG